MIGLATNSIMFRGTLLRTLKFYDYYPYKNKFWNGNIIKYAYFAKLIEKKIDFSSINTFLEIGAGYGGWINQLLHCNPNAKIFVIDLPETLLLSH